MPTRRNIRSWGRCLRQTCRRSRWPCWGWLPGFLSLLQQLLRVFKHSRSRVNSRHLLWRTEPLNPWSRAGRDTWVIHSELFRQLRSSTNSQYLIIDWTLPPRHSIRAGIDTWVIHLERLQLRNIDYNRYLVMDWSCLPKIQYESRHGHLGHIFRVVQTLKE